MPKHCYVQKRFNEVTLGTIAQANKILREFASQGFDLTLRQLYYQFVAQALIENTDRSYKRLGSIVNDARLAGLIDWEYIVDRTRYVRSLVHQMGPQHALNDAAAEFRLDLWCKQDNYVEVWIEKDALIGVIQDVCCSWDVPFFSCRGYTSQSELWRAAQRFINRMGDAKDCHLIHLGDHDPSGIDMTRDNGARLDLFGVDVEVHRIALNMDQVDEYSLPANPTKLTDTRAATYTEKHGYDSWELDALQPRVIVDLIDAILESLVDLEVWDKVVQRQEDIQGCLTLTAQRWPEVQAFLSESGS